MRIPLGLVLIILTSFLTSLSIANTPYPFFGYGPSAFVLFAAGLLFKPILATASIFIGTAAAAILISITQSAFTLTVIGAVIIRTAQAFILSSLRPRIGSLGSMLTTTVFGTIVATLLGLGFYGGDAINVSLTIFEAVFIPPAYVLAKAVEREARLDRKILGGIVFIAVIGIFLSAAPYLVPLGVLVSLLILFIASYSVLTQRMLRGTGMALLFLAIVLIAVPASLLTNQTPLAYNVRNFLYPLYPDSLEAKQWFQKNSSPACLQGNVAGGGTIESGVWGPQRLRVLDTCVSVTGVVEGIYTQSGPSNDNDFTIDLRVDPEYSHYISVGSIVLRDGYLHIEVVPSMQESLKDTLTRLKPGDRILVIGSLVLDTDHGFWAEIHPAWEIVILS